MGTDCKSAAFQLRWFESTRAHQENACVEIHERFSFAQTANSRKRVDSNSIGRRHPSRRQKSPCGAFLDARLAISTRAHQKGRRALKTTLVQTKIHICAQKPAPGSCCSRPGAGFLCVKDSEKGKGSKREFRFYAAFAGAKTSAFFRRACIERTMQLRVKLMIK